MRAICACELKAGDVLALRPGDTTKERVALKARVCRVYPARLGVVTFFVNGWDEEEKDWVGLGERFDVAANFLIHIEG
jgi:hypothetical protein